MIRAKGGRRQPRYYYLKEAGEKRLVGLINKQKIETQENKTSQICQKLLLAVKQIDMFIAAIKAKIKKI